MLYEKLNYILAIAEEQNLTRAAKRLFISQPALTLYLNRLEDELGVKLFDRSHSPVILTDAGQYYISEMKKLAASEIAMRSHIKLIADPEQTLIIGIGQVRGQDWLPLALPAFCSAHPQVNIQVVQAGEFFMNEELHAHHMDVAIGALPASVSDLEMVDLMYEDLCFAAHKNFRLIPDLERNQYSPENPYIVLPQNLEGLPFICPQVGNGLYGSYEKAVLDNEIHPSRIIAINNLRTGLLLAKEGLGILLLSSSVLATTFHSRGEFDSLDYFRLKDMATARKCIAAYDRDNIKADLIRDFIKILKRKVLPRCQYVRPISEKE